MKKIAAALVAGPLVLLAAGNYLLPGSAENEPVVRSKPPTSTPAMAARSRFEPRTQAQPIDARVSAREAPRGATAPSAVGTASMKANAPVESPVPQLPLALERFDPDLLELEPDQVTALREAEQLFVDLVGGEDQNASDPAYLERWQAAQPHVDMVLRTRIGDNAFQQIQDFLIQQSQEKAAR